MNQKPLFSTEETVPRSGEGVKIRKENQIIPDSKHMPDETPCQQLGTVRTHPLPHAESFGSTFAIEFQVHSRRMRIAQSFHPAGRELKSLGASILDMRALKPNGQTICPKYRNLSFAVSESSGLSLCLSGVLSYHVRRPSHFLGRRSGLARSVSNCLPLVARHCSFTCATPPRRASTCCTLSPNDQLARRLNFLASKPGGTARNGPHPLIVAPPTVVS